MSRNLREALNDVVGDSTWRPDNTLVIHDAEKWTALVGYIVMATNGDNDGQVPMGCEGAVAEARAPLETEMERLKAAAALRGYARHVPMCSYRPTYPDTDEATCDCGFDAVLEAYNAALEEPTP